MKHDADRTDRPVDHRPVQFSSGLFHAFMLAKYIEELARVEEMFALSVAESGVNIDVAKELWDIAQRLHTVADCLIHSAQFDISKSPLNGASLFIQSIN